MPDLRRHTRNMEPALVSTDDLGDVWVCHDCYFAHHYGMREVDGEWFTGDSDQPAHCQPLSRLDGLDLSDRTCSEHQYADGIFEPCEHCGGTDHENGMTEFTWSSCQGCGCHLGGSRYRLAIHPSKEVT